MASETPRPGGDTIVWTYTFTLSLQRTEVITVVLDSRTLTLVDLDRALPDWTRLEFHQCPHCPLSAADHPACPLAAAVVRPIDAFADVVSYETVKVEIRSAQRTVIHEMPAQNAVGSLMGLLMAGSGCPYTSFFRPMARYHLPLATQPETLYRAASMYMLAQFFRHQEGKPADLTFEGLSQIYRDIETLNVAMARRILEAINEDAAVNAVVVLDFFAKNWAFSVLDHLSDFKPLFAPYFSDDGPLAARPPAPSPGEDASRE